MVRNEADIMELFIRQAVELFDHFTFVDVNSTDGTQGMLAKAAGEQKNISVLSCATKEKYQAAMMNSLARQALGAAVDWIFFLDADEFLPVESRLELEAYLNGFGGEVMSMPWINLVPSSYSDFRSFDPSQKFYWSGRASNFCKIAVSSLYFHNNPDALIAEGNHTISPFKDAAPSAQILGFPLLHVPVRSRERLKYRMTNSLRFLRSKHNTLAGEGGHVSSILRLIEDVDASANYLNAIAADYGQSNTTIEALDPAELAWPTKVLPAYLRTELAEKQGRALSIGVTLAADAQVEWHDPGFVKNAPVGAAIDGDELRIVAQPISGRLQPRYERFEALPPVNRAVAPQLGPNCIPQLLSNTLATSLLPVKFATFSAWSRLIPLLFALFAIARPRRFVELGVHNGMSFFAGCQVAEHLQAETECIAVDSWIGDPHASFHDLSVFDEFKKNLIRDYPDAYFIQGMFSHARDCFDDESIDLLHIDGYHTYDAVKEDFDTWLSKMSDTGIIIFHDINVHERNFGVWQFWRELRERYLALSFMHSHGLGVFYVGRQENAIAAIFRWLIDNPAYFSAAQRYFEILGENAIDYKTKIDDARRAQEASATKDRKVEEFTGYIVVASALRLFTRAIRVKRLFVWPFKSVRTRCRKQIKIAKFMRRAQEASATKDRKVEEFTGYLAHRDDTIRRQEAERAAIAFNAELGDRRDHVIVVASALRLFTRAIRVKRLFVWPFKSVRTRCRKQIKIANFMRRSLYGFPNR